MQPKFIYFGICLFAAILTYICVYIRAKKLRPKNKRILRCLLCLFFYSVFNVVAAVAFCFITKNNDVSSFVNVLSVAELIGWLFYAVVLVTLYNKGRGKTVAGFIYGDDCAKDTVAFYNEKGAHLLKKFDTFNNGTLLEYYDEGFVSSSPSSIGAWYVPIAESNASAENIDRVCREAIMRGVCRGVKWCASEGEVTVSDLYDGGTFEWKFKGRLLFLVPLNDLKAHKAFVSFVIEEGLVPKRPDRRMYDVSFFIGERSDAAFALSDFVNLRTGEDILKSRSAFTTLLEKIQRRADSVETDTNGEYRAQLKVDVAKVRFDEDLGSESEKKGVSDSANEVKPEVSTDIKLPELDKDEKNPSGTTGSIAFVLSCVLASVLLYIFLPENLSIWYIVITGALTAASMFLFFVKKNSSQGIDGETDTIPTEKKSRELRPFWMFGVASAFAFVAGVLSMLV